MASTYVNDLRLNEMATGDASGTWGDTTNTNLELIGEALGFGTEAITTNADTHTSTVADGATDPVRAMYVKYTGTLDSACTITIAPNTMSRMQFIENATSGSQNIIISQGSGANVTIPAGDVKAVYLDGAGSGAAVTDAFASLNVVDLKVQDDLTVTDDATIGGTLGVTGTVTLAGDIDLAGGIDVDGTSNLDIVDIDGAVDMASTLQVDGAITSSAGATITVSDNSDNLTLTSTDADANSGPNLRMYRNSGSPADSDAIGLIDFEGRNDNSQDVVYAAIDTRIVDASDGTEDGRIEVATILAGTAGVSRILMDATETAFNDNSKNLDFRVESDGNANMLFVDGGNNQVGIATNDFNDMGSSSYAGLKVGGATFQDSGGGNGSATHILNNSYVGSGNNFYLDGGGASSGIQLTSGDINFFTFDGSGGSADAQVSYTSRLHIAETGVVGIGTTSPATTLHMDASGGAVLRMQRTSASASNKLELSYDGTDATISSSEDIIFSTFSSEDARFADGTLLIGSTTLDGNSAKFQIFQNSNNKFTGAFICDGNNVNRFGPMIRCGTDDNSGTNTMLTFQDGDGTGIGSITSSGGTVTYGAFTAHHEVNVPNSDNPSDDSDAYPYGTLVEVVSVYLTEANKRQSIRYTVQKSQSANSKKVLGAYSSNMRPSPMCPTTGTYANNLHNISILGDGHIICNNSGGNIEVGDGICTSSTAGIGMKATDNPSMIVGIAQEAVTFSGSETKLVAVQFGVQQFTPWS